MEASPLILTLRLNEEAFLFFDSLRKQFFPSERNFLSAHLTLFHHLPPNENKIVDDIGSLTQKQHRLNLSISNVVSIGNGVAYKVDSPELLRIHKNLQDAWESWLIPQDKQKIWPHITVQNKVLPAIAKKTLERLMSSFESFTAYGIGIDLWRYEGGPWNFIQHFPFMQKHFSS